jgi:tryptophanyl-tRNA synthetase
MSEYADSKMIRENCIEVLLDWLAVGIDPRRSVVFMQSHVPEHAELHLALSMITPLGWLERNPTYKEQILNMQNKDLGTYAFLGYPVLMAADILLYKAEVVPVGEDQSAHLEITREIARRFNSFFGEVFPEPQMLLTPTPRVPGTDGRKMSKSYGNAINISDPFDLIWEKLRTMVTDPARYRRTDPGDPDKCPVWDLHKVFTQDLNKRNELDRGCRTAGIGCIDCKKVLFENIKNALSPIQDKRRYYEAHREEFLDVLYDGAKKAKSVAKNVMEEVKVSVGLTL